ncbi:MAG: hypothetical protein ACLUI5_11570 [Fusicatenibacter saccharivorans]
MKEEKDFNAGFFIVSVRSGYAAPITSGGASRRGTAVTFGWRNKFKVALRQSRLKASPISTELIVDSRRAVRRICGFYTCLFK